MEILPPLWSTSHICATLLQKSVFFPAHQSFLCCRGTCWLPHEGRCSGFVLSFLKWQTQLTCLPISILFARLNKSCSLVVSLSKTWPRLEYTAGFYQCECTLLAHVPLDLHWNPDSLQSCFPASSQPVLVLFQMETLHLSLLNFMKFMLPTHMPGI